MTNKERRNRGLAYLADEDRRKLFRDEDIDEKAWGDL